MATFKNRKANSSSFISFINFSACFFMQIFEIPFLYWLQDLWSAWMFIHICHSDLKELEQWNKDYNLMEVMIYLYIKLSVVLGLDTM